MSGLDNNPFADPFKDPAVQRAMQSSPNSNPQQQPAVAGYGGTSLSNPRPAAAQIGVPLSEEDLFRQQEELRRREQELQRRQQEFQQQQRAQMGGGGGGLPGGGGGPAPAHNWPPLPAFVPLQPCFYQDIDVEIPVHFQETVRFVYYVYLVYVLALAANVVGALLYMLFAGGAFGLFLLAIIQMAIFSPCAFLLWFRPVYKAFRDDSSFNFMMFFLVLFFHTIFCFVQMLGFSYAVGWFTTIEVFKISIFVGILMLVPTLAFTAAFVGMCLSLVKVHRFYRGNFTLDKARQEFSNNVMADRNVQNAANTAARAAAAHAVNEVASGRY